MPRLIRSLDMLLSEFNALKASLAPHATLQKLHEDFQTRRSALRWLKEKSQDEDNAEKSEFEQTVCATESNHSKYERLRTLETKIKQKMKAEAPTRLFLIVADMLAGLKVEPLLFSDFMEDAHRDHVSSHLQQVLGQNKKMFCYNSVLKMLDELLNYRDDCVKCSNILHYNVLKDKFNSIHTLAHLHGILHERLTEFFNDFLPNAKKCTSLNMMDLGTRTALRTTTWKRGSCHCQNSCVW